MILCGRQYDVQHMESLSDRSINKLKSSEQEELMQFKMDVYQTYMNIQDVHNENKWNPIDMHTVKNELNDKWLHTYCSLTREDAEKVIYFVEKYFYEDVTK
ncbi:hypothetical protein [Bacillus sp. CDB3]|uniref:hypothetical protein n=1 Tax=Bacillus sp. CDB3 TaxID=360310 RepID=UPI0009D892E9|nr:hypothetical protein [Bacillus sp. CDB3]OQR54752.1 hypothetical protein CDB3_22060 [Bacillus sp. CDB3]